MRLSLIFTAAMLCLGSLPAFGGALGRIGPAVSGRVASMGRVPTLSFGVPRLGLRGAPLASLPLSPVLEPMRLAVPDISQTAAVFTLPAVSPALPLPGVFAELAAAGEISRDLIGGVEGGAAFVKAEAGRFFDLTAHHDDYGNTASEAGERQYAYVEGEKREQEAVRHAHAELPVIDYRRRAFDEHWANEFAEKEFLLGGQTLTGRQILEFLMTAHSVVFDVAFDPTLVDMGLFGKSDADLHAFVRERGLSKYLFTSIMEEAFRQGLVYRVRDDDGSKTYYGVPYEVRSALGLEAPAAASAAGSLEGVETAVASPAAEAVLELARDAESLPAQDELFEFAAGVTHEMIKAGRLHAEDLSGVFRSRAKDLAPETGNLQGALLILLESSFETDWFARVKELSLRAAEEGIVDPAELQSVLAELR